MMKMQSEKKAGKGQGKGGRRKVWRAGLVVLVGLACLPFGAAAKKKKPPTKTVTGEVMDATDNAIVGAAVELTDLRTGKKLAIYTEPDGRYSFTGLDPNHDYQVQASFKGQSSEARKASLFDDRAIVVLNLRIPASPQR